MRNAFTLPDDIGLPNLLSSGKEEFGGNNEKTEFGMTTSILASKFLR